jgi:ribonucleoside-triphosphate reductase
MDYVIKRNGTKVPFDKSKIVNAIEKAMTNTPEGIDSRVSNAIADYIADMPDTMSVEQIQDIVVDQLKNSPLADVAEAYSHWRKLRQEIRDKEKTNASILEILDAQNDAINEENSNKNPTINSTQRDYMAGEVSKELTDRLLLSDDIREANKEGILHVHDRDYFVMHTHNCDLINLDDMLQNGTVISGTYIEKPHSFSTACNIATQIVAQVASQQYGGQSITLSHLAPFVDISRKKIAAELHNEFYEMMQNDEIDKMPSEEIINRIAETRLHKEVEKGVQTIQYQVVTLMTTNGQAPFITVFMYLDEVPEGQTRDDLAMIIEEVLKQRIQGVKNEVGAWVTPAFPKLIYVLDEDDIYPESKYYYLTELAAKCSAKRMVPDYISAKKMMELKGGVWTSMGCRSFLTPDRTTENVANAGNWVKGHKYYGRFNQGVVTINLPDVALSSGKDFDKFWKIFDERLELCHRALQIRHKRLLGTPSDMAPILWQYGALARLKKGEKIDKLLYGGYSTISLGYAGLYECVKYMTGKSHTDPEAKPFALEVMQHMNDKCTEWKTAENIDYSLYGTPLETTTYEFAKCLQKRFGIIPEVTDHDYITNSYHVNVREHIDAFSKLKFESEFQKLSPGGCLSYVEVPNMQNNILAVLSVMRFIYDNIMYAELNTKSDYCQVCGYSGEIQIVNDEKAKRLVWECPNCGNRDQAKMNVVRRTCGYLGTNYWNQGRTQEIRDRVVHLSDN